MNEKVKLLFAWSIVTNVFMALSAAMLATHLDVPAFIGVFILYLDNLS